MVNPIGGLMVGDKFVPHIPAYQGKCRVCRKPMNGVVHVHTLLTATKKNRLGRPVLGREVWDRKFTQTARDAIVDAFDNGAGYTLDNFRYHGSGTGAVAEDETDTVLGAEVETPRDAGTQTQPTADVYQTVATHTYAGGFTITEHGLFSATTAGDLCDRTVFGGIVVVASDKIEFTFQLTISSEA